MNINKIGVQTAFGAKSNVKTNRDPQRYNNQQVGVNQSSYETEQAKIKYARATLAAAGYSEADIDKFVKKPKK
ncbi:hypothetical protein tpqmel_0740 [Candidatus Gastranaerophilus sp. (ex Termes propinquus)]|nr:hypothetical protein tpqmel_0740 [Candidatus Gastranaerophilus sp. (ex Termes propinquus)]